MKETRSIKIKEKIFKKIDFKKLSDEIFHEYENIKSQNNDPDFTITITCDDDSQYVTEDTSIFDTNSTLDNKKVVSIVVDLWSIHPHRRIRLNLEHVTDEYMLYRNQLEITGDDSNWVNGTLNRLEEIIDAVEPQNRIARKLSYVIDTLIYIFIGLIVLWVLHFALELAIGREIEIREEAFGNVNDNIYIFLKYIIASWVGFIILLGSNYRTVKLWPYLEFQIGPDHKRYEKKKRNILSIIFFAAILPVFISFGYDIAMSSIKNDSTVVETNDEKVNVNETENND